MTRTTENYNPLMKASATEFRLRYWVHLAIYVLGFVAPWNYVLHLDATGFAGRAVWLPLAFSLERTGVLSLARATDALLVMGILFALAGAMLRTWGAAYLSSAIVKDGAMHGGAIVADGPYRHLRNPLYLGTFLHTFALALLMPASGAVFTIVLIGIEQLRLIGGEEAFLAEKLGQPYLDYKARVPSVIPSLAARVPASGTRPMWAMAFLGEIYMWGVAIAFASVGWRYNAVLVTQGVVIAFGVSLVARAFIAEPKIEAVAARPEA